MFIRAWLIAAAFGLIVCSGQAQEQAQSAGGETDDKQYPSDPPAFAIPIIIVESKAATYARQRSEEEARQREISDLAAQQGMSAATQTMNDATQRMAEYTFWSTILVGVGTFLLVWTLGLTRQANQAARDAVEVTRDVGIKQLRAYLEVTVSKVRFLGHRIPEIGFCLTNNGETPASEVLVKTIAVYRRGDTRVLRTDCMKRRDIAKGGCDNFTIPMPLLQVPRSDFGDNMERLERAEFFVGVFAADVFDRAIYVIRGFWCNEIAEGTLNAMIIDKWATGTVEEFDKVKFQPGPKGPQEMTMTFDVPAGTG